MILDHFLDSGRVDLKQKWSRSRPDPPSARRHRTGGLACLSQKSGDRLRKACQPQGLLQAFVGAEHHGGAKQVARLHATARRDGQYPDAGIVAAELNDGFQTVLVRHEHIENHEINRHRGDDLEGFIAVRRLDDGYEVVEQGGQRAIRVVLRGHRPSFFANMLPPGGWNFVGEATATSVGLVPLCVLVTGTSRPRILHLLNSSRLAAPSCMVHSNHDILVEGGSITAAAVQAVTSARGTISPSPGTGAAPIDDPFANLDLDQPRGVDCTASRVFEPLRLAAGSRRIQAGVHCGGLDISGSATVVLEPGEHWFLSGHLAVRQNARLEGDDVVLFFDSASRFAFTDRALVRLAGRTTGAYAGIVMGATRDNRQDFIISSDNVESLLGVVYVPGARMVVEGRADVARDSAWTVIVAHSLQMRGSPSLFINADYNATRVPVPAGVGPRTGGSRLIE